MISGTIARDDLVRRIIDADGHVLIQAGAGYGKSVLLGQVATSAATVVQVRAGRRGESLDALRLRLRVAYENAGELVLAGMTTDPVDPRSGTDVGVAGAPGAVGRIVLLVDDAEDLDEVQASWLARHVLAAGPGLHLVAAGRSMPTALAQLEFDANVDHVTTDDLSATEREVAAFLDQKVPSARFPQAVVAGLRQRSAGWFTLLHAITQRAAGTRDPVATVLALVEQNALLPALLARVLRDLTLADQQSLARLAHFDHVNALIVNAVAGVGALDRYLAAGVPFSMSADGWISLPRPVSAHLGALTSLDRETALLAAPLLIAAGKTMTALDGLFEVGDVHAAARVLDGLESGYAGELDCSELLAAIDRLGPVGDAWPRVHMLRARAYAQLAWLAEERDAIDTALRLARQQDLQVLCREVESAQLRVRARETGDVALLADVDRLERALEGAELPTRARLSETRGILAAWKQEAQGLARAEVYYRHAAALWAQSGDTWLHAQTLRGLAVAALLPAGRYDVAMRELRHALELGGSNLLARVQSLVFLAQVAAASGDADAAIPLLAEVRTLASAAGLGWMEGYADWAEIHLAVLREDPPAIRTYVDGALVHLGQLADQGTGELVIAEAADAFARAGDPESGAALLAEHRDRLTHAVEDVALARLSIAAHGGETGAAIQLAGELIADKTLPPARRWRVQLLRALALARAGRIEEADRCYTDGRRSAADWGVGHLPALVEPVLCRTMDRLLSSSQGDAASTGSFTVKVLGGFEVWHGSSLMTIAPGNPTRLIKVVAANSGLASVDVVCESLWPDADSDTGRRRLKNVLLRARETSGGLVSRREDNIGFVEGSMIDVVAFGQHCREVQSSLAGDMRTGTRQAQHALEMYGTLLPDDLYEEWTSGPREVMRRKAWRLIDIVLAEGVDAACASWLADLVSGIDPYDDARLVRLAGMLAEHGSYALASALLEQAESIGGALGGQTPVGAASGRPTNVIRSIG
jgi:DNA-binding SARP family transcriptional activator